MTGATFVVCPTCERLMLGQRTDSRVYPQPHICAPPSATEDES